MIIESDKRKESELKGRLIPVNPTGKQKVYPGGIFSVYCCSQAFNPKSTCKLVLCMGYNDEQGGRQIPILKVLNKGGAGVMIMQHGKPI